MTARPRLKMTVALFGAACLMAGGPVLAQSTQRDAPVVAEGGGGERSSAGELFFLVEELRTEVRQLRGQLEETRHQLERQNRQGRERYVDLDERLMELSSRMAELEDSRTARAGGDSASPQQVEPVSGSVELGSVDYRQPGEAEREAYASIQYLIQEQGDFDAAIDEIYDFIDEYPEGDLTVNAYYWLGELYLAQESYDQARQAFTIVTSRHETHRKAPDALFKLAVTRHRDGDDEAAGDVLDRLQSRYTETEAAALGKAYREENL